MLRRFATSGVATLIVLSGTSVAVAPDAVALADVHYRCSTLGRTASVSALIDTSAPTPPARMFVGETTTITSISHLPGDTAKTAKDGGAKTFEGTVRLTLVEGGTTRQVALTIPRTPLGEQSMPQAVAYTASGTYDAIAPGDVDILPGDFTADLEFRREDGATDMTYRMSCYREYDPTPTIDSVVVAARSSTVLSLDRPVVTYGEQSPLVATVTTTGGSPKGDLEFVVDGAAKKVGVDPDGRASIPLGGWPVGPHDVHGIFVPADPVHYTDSTSASMGWTVVKARTRMRLRPTGTTTLAVTRLVVRATGEFGTVPGGRLRIRVTRFGRAGAWVGVRTVDRTGAAHARLGRLEQGRYRVVVRYQGDADHLYRKRATTFRVRDLRQP